MGPVFQRTTTVGGAATSQPLQTAPAWQHRFMAIDMIIEYMIISTAVADTYDVSLASNTAVQSSNIPGGGTVGIFPSFADFKKSIVGFATQELAFTLAIAAAGSVMLEIHLTPMGAEV